MPVSPHTWEPGDPVSPTYLNGDLYCFGYAGPFDPTGVQFHARKPVYKAVAGGTATAGSASWSYAFNAGASVLEDSCGDYGNHLDPPQWGTIQNTLPGADGISTDTGGGWFLLSAFTPIGNASANGTMFAADVSENGSNTSYGQAVAAADGQQATPWTADLVQMLPSDAFTAYAGNGDSATKDLGFTASGDQRTVRFQGHWASTAPDFGIPGAYPPAPRQAWSSGDQWSSFWANGPAGVASVLQFINCPPVLRVTSGTASTSLANETAGVIKLTTVSLDTWSAFSTGTYTWTCPADGLYLVFGLVFYGETALTGQTSARVNGTDYWGPANYGSGTSHTTSTSAKAQVFSLLAGDTVQMAGWQDSGGTLGTSSGLSSRLVIVWLSEPGIPGLVNTNPYFTQGSLAGWGASGGTAAATQALPGAPPYPWGCLLTPSGAGTATSLQGSASPFTVLPSAWYGASAWVYPSGTQATQLGFGWADSGTAVSSSLASFAPAGSAWSLIHTIQQAPSSGVNQGYPVAGRISAGTIPAAVTTYLAGIQAGQPGVNQPVPPDLAWRYTAGTPGGSVAAVFTTYLANDLSFLTWRPYLLAYQTVADSVPDTTETKVTMDTVAGMVHGDYGDNFGGWLEDSYTAQRPGWHLVVAELFITADTSASYPMVEARIVVSTGPASDCYEFHVVPSAAIAAIPGATALAYCYLREGDSVYPAVYTVNYATENTYVTAGHRSHFEVVWISS